MPPGRPRGSESAADAPGDPAQQGSGQRQDPFQPESSLRRPKITAQEHAPVPPGTRQEDVPMQDALRLPTIEEDDDDDDDDVRMGDETGEVFEETMDVGTNVEPADDDTEDESSSDDEGKSVPFMYLEQWCGEGLLMSFWLSCGRC